MAVPPSHKVALGQFYTSDTVADFMVGLCQAGKAARVLEPSCGPGVFLSALARAGYRDVLGVDIDPANVAAATARATGAQVRHQDFLELADPEGFDLIIGNPPYVRWRNLGAGAQAAILGDPRFSPLANGQWDLLYAFMAGAVDLLRPGGELVFIVPTGWMGSTHAAGLRRRLAERGALELMIHFGEFKLFADCAPNCVIFRYRAGAAPGPIWVADFAGRAGRVEDVLAAVSPHLPRADEPAGGPEAEHRDGDWHIFRAPAFAGADSWHLVPPAERAELTAIEGLCAGATLGDLADIGVGVVSGRDEAYVLTPAQTAALGGAGRGLVRSFVKPSGCARYRPAASVPLLFPEGVSEQWLTEHAPGVLAHLSAHRAGLEARYRSDRRPWFSWATVRNLPLFERAAGTGKLFIPGIDRSGRPRFSYSEEALLGGGDVMMVTPAAGIREDPRYLLAWLNSDRVAAWYRRYGSHMGQRARYTPPFLARIPVPAIRWSEPAEAALHERVVALAAARLAAQDPGEQERLEAAVEDAFGRLGATRAAAD